MIVFLSVVTAHTLLLVLYPVWNVLETVTHPSLQLEVIRIVKLVQQIHTHTNQQHLEKAFVVPSVLQDSIQTLVLHLVHYAQLTSISLEVDRLLVLNVAPVLLRKDQVHQLGKIAILFNALKHLVFMEAFVCLWPIASNVSAQLDFLEGGAKLI